jgi:hypothetical protein
VEIVLNKVKKENYKNYIVFLSFDYIYIAIGGPVIKRGGLGFH